MADVFGSSSLEVTNSEVAIYTCPPGGAVDVGSVSSVTAAAQVNPTQTIVTSISIVNFHASSSDILYMYVTETGAAPSGSETDKFLSYGVLASTTVFINPGILLSPGNTVWVDSVVGSLVAVTINYIEVT